MMSGRSRTSCSCASRRGLTLIEVVAGLALLAGLLVSVLLAKAQHTRQLAMAQRRQAAIAAADGLLAEWWQNPAALPRAATGNVGADLAWRTSVVRNDAARQLGASVVRLEIAGQQDPGRPPEVLVAVEVLVADKPEQPAPRVGGRW